ATQENLITLGIVAAWRVVLMIRVVSGLMGYATASSAILVLFFADILAQIAVFLMPTPVIPLMGGVRANPTESILLQAQGWIRCVGICSLPFWFCALVGVLSREKPSWQLPATMPADNRRPGTALLVLAGLSMLVWAILLPAPQAEQRRRYAIE